MALVRMTLGAIFTLLGFAGLLLPVLPGWLFFIFALLMFFPNTRLATRIVLRMQPRFPRFGHLLRRLGVGSA